MFPGRPGGLEGACARPAAQALGEGGSLHGHIRRALSSQAFRSGNNALTVHDNPLGFLTVAP
ncbi:hypothetical protein GCM10010298_56660 [Streptomyces microflavus]|uniref:Uncharacterized protein n=1 Tax=Streptomyces microflavus TaxID=1919 RepID=A0A7J0CQG3_STRMI|nr:hypothetical protein Smic_31240 [Streptomyces microflavus]GGX83967.1 hypothetical protein GCM10010298_56660 [Streptomyces microflavus]